MLTPTHLTVVVLAAMLLRLDRGEWFVAMMFGVVIDADHLFALPRYVSDNGWAALLRQSWDDSSGLPWRSWLHEPMAAIAVGHLSTGWRFALPLAFWEIHVGMDEAQRALGGLNIYAETALLLGSAGGITWICYGQWSLATGGSGLRAFASSVAESSRARLSSLRGVI